MGRVAILHAGPYTRLFGEFPQRLSRALELPVVDSDEGLDWAYVLAWDLSRPLKCRSFIPVEALSIVQDKRLQTKAFSAAGVSTPETHLFERYSQVQELLSVDPSRKWLLKFPTACAAVGHQLLTPSFVPTPFWSAPFVVQAVVEQHQPQVFRLYSVDGELFGWNVRRFPKEVPGSLFVTLARGAQYQPLGPAPTAAQEQAARALLACGLFDSFGAVDLLLDKEGRYQVLEVNADGIDNFVLRDVNLGPIATDIDARLHRALRRRLEASTR